MAYILDAAVILIFLLMLVIGYKRGLVKSLLRLGGSLLAMLAAWGIAAAVAAPIFDAAVAPVCRSLRRKTLLPLMRPPSMNSSRRFSISYRGRSQTVWRPVGQGLRKKLRRIWAAWSAPRPMRWQTLWSQRIPSGRRAADPDGEFPTAVYRADDYLRISSPT